MTMQTLNKGNNLVSEIEWCRKIREHIGKKQRLSFCFDTTQSCIESFDSMRCPDWLLEKIQEEVRKHQEEVETEFEEL